MRSFTTVCTYLLAATLSLTCASRSPAGTIATFNTSLGSFQVELYDSATPITVANFLKYVNDGEYNGTFIHRVATNNYQTTGTPFAVQGGRIPF